MNTCTTGMLANFISLDKSILRGFNSAFTLLRGKLIKLGISGRMLEALKSLYNEVKCAVRINGQISDWFDVKIGLKQGCILSPLLFKIFIND